MSKLNRGDSFATGSAPMEVQGEVFGCIPTGAERGRYFSRQQRRRESMNTKNKTLMFTVTAALASIGARADTYFDYTYGIEWSYTINADNTATIDSAWQVGSPSPDPYYPSYYYFDWDGTIPSDFNGHTVTAIGDSALSGLSSASSVNYIYLPDSVKFIGDYAFSGFYNLWSVEFPADLEYLGYQPFDINSNMGIGWESVDENGNVLGMDGWVIGRNPYNSITSANLTMMYDSQIPVKGVAGGAFENCTELNSVILPNTIKHIAPYAFAGCTGLGEIVIPASVVSITNYAFYGASSLTNITFLGNAPGVGEAVFTGVSQDCVVYVQQGTAGWGTVPGTWNGLPTRYAETVSAYTITWLEYDGSLVDAGEWVVGATPFHEPLERAADAQYTYTFIGWSPEIETVRSNTTYTAQYSQALRAYSVQWNNWNGQRLLTRSVNYGTTPNYNQAIPTKPEDTLHTYTFAGWTPAIVPVTGPATYTATFTVNAKYAGAGTESDPYVVTNKAALLNLFSLGGSLYVKLQDGLEIEGSITVPASVTSLSVDMNGGTITGTTGNAAVILAGNTAFSAKGTGTISADSGIEAVQRPGAVSATSGVTITGMGGQQSEAAAFADGGRAVATEFTQGTGNKWVITAFAELESGTADGIFNDQVQVCRASSLSELNNAAPMNSGVEVKEKTNAVKVKLEVVAPDNAPSQFFKVKFGR